MSTSTTLGVNEQYQYRVNSQQDTAPKEDGSSCTDTSSYFTRILHSLMVYLRCRAYNVTAVVFPHRSSTSKLGLPVLANSVSPTTIGVPLRIISPLSRQAHHITGFCFYPSRGSAVLSTNRIWGQAFKPSPPILNFATHRFQPHP